MKWMETDDGHFINVKHISFFYHQINNNSIAVALKSDLRKALLKLKDNEDSDLINCYIIDVVCYIENNKENLIFTKQDFQHLANLVFGYNYDKEDE